MRYRLNTTTKNGQKAAYVSWFLKGKRSRRFFATKQLAQAWIDERSVRDSEVQQIWLGIPEAGQLELVNLWQTCERRGIRPSDLLAGSATAQVSEVTLKQALDGLLAAKEKGGHSQRYLKNVRNLLGQFVRGREERPIAAVTREELQAFIDGVALASRPTYRARCSTFFRFARRRGWIVANPCEMIDNVRLAPTAPTIFTVDQVARALSWITGHCPRLLGWFVLSTFCGLRPEEADQTPWEAVDFEAGLIRVEAQTSKMRQRRVVYPMPAAMAWLREAKRLKSELPIASDNRRRILGPLRGVLGWKVWAKDITRHSAASYWLAETDNAAQVAEMLGHDVRTLRRHYRALVTREAARAFWAIRPGPHLEVLPEPAAASA